MSKDRGRWSGVFPATLVPFLEDGRYSLDEEGLDRYLSQFVKVEGISGVVVNGHTGEIQSLFPEERNRVVAIAREAVGSSLLVISGVSAEGTLEAIDHAVKAEEAGADAILIMPPHGWLRFGREPETAIRFVTDVAAAVDCGVIVHQYPRWTKVSYSTEELLRLASIENIVAVKEGSRDIGVYERNVKCLRQAAPDLSILTCHDEYLLPTLIQGVDGALVGFAGFVPEIICALVAAAAADDLPRAREISERLFVLKQAVYRMGEPSADSHQRMKAAMHLCGRISSPCVRPPLAPLVEELLVELSDHLSEVGLLPVAVG